MISSSEAPALPVVLSPVQSAESDADDEEDVQGPWHFFNAAEIPPFPVFEASGAPRQPTSELSGKQVQKNEDKQSDLPKKKMGERRRANR